VPRYCIHLTNSEFESSDESDFPSLDSACRSAIMGATKVLSEAIVKGAVSVAVEIEVHEGDQLLARKVVSLNVADLSGGDRTRF